MAAAASHTNNEETNNEDNGVILYPSLSPKSPFRSRQKRKCTPPSACRYTMSKGKRKNAGEKGISSQCDSIILPNDIEICWLCGFPIKLHEYNNADVLRFISLELGYTITIYTVMLLMKACEHIIPVLVAAGLLTELPHFEYSTNEPRINPLKLFDRAHNGCNFGEGQGNFITIDSKTNTIKINTDQLSQWPDVLFNKTRGISQDSRIILTSKSDPSEVHTFPNLVQAFIFLKWKQRQQKDQSITHKSVIKEWKKEIYNSMFRRLNFIVTFFNNIQKHTTSNTLGHIIKRMTSKSNSTYSNKNRTNYNKLLKKIQLIPRLSHLLLQYNKHDKGLFGTIFKPKKSYAISTKRMYKKDIYNFSNLISNSHTQSPVSLSPLPSKKPKTNGGTRRHKN